MAVLEDYLVDPNLSLLDRTKIQAQVLVPVLCALRAELGREKKRLFATIGERMDGRPRRKRAAIQTEWGEVSGKHVTAEIRRHDKEALDIDVTRCRFAEFFRALGEPELGALLVCEADFDIAAAGGGDVSLTREQTIMQGAPNCTFRFRFAPR